MAPFSVRFASARKMAGHAPIRVTAIEVRLGTRYTVDTLAKLQRLYRGHDFIWLMGEDNLVTFRPVEGLAPYREVDPDCGDRASGL